MVRALSLAVMGMINIIYGALCAMAQTDFKKLVAYSSVSHMGYVLLGMASVTPQGMNGAVLQMFNHGTITAMLFLLVGVVYDRAHHREIDGFGGLWPEMPVYGTLHVAGLLRGPGPARPVRLHQRGSDLHRRLPDLPGHHVISAMGIVLGAAYMLWTLQRVFLGPLNPKYATMPEINRREIFTLVPLGILVIVLGFYPMPVLDLMRASSTQLVDLVWHGGVSLR